VGGEIEGLNRLKEWGWIQHFLMRLCLICLYTNAHHHGKHKLLSPEIY
jgi:hypothetical protein